MTQGPVATTPAPLTRHGNFLKLWSGQSVALLGYEITEIALPLAAILVLNASAADIGLIGGARWLPFVLLSLWIGAWCERRRRLPLMVFADLSRAVLLLAVVAAALTDLLSMPLLVAAVFLFGALTVLFDVCYATVLVSVVPNEQLVAANGRLQASASVAQAGGPGLGGVLVQWLTAPVTLLVQAGGFLVSAGFLSRMRVAEEVADDGTRPGAVAAVRGGLRAVFGDPLLRSLVCVGAVFNLFSQWVVALFPLFAVRDLDLNPGLLGLIISAAAVGGLVGAMVATRLSTMLGPGPAIVLSSAVASVPLILVAFTPDDKAVAVAWLISVFAVAGFGWTIGGILITSIRQAYTPRAVLARVNATYRFLASGLVAVGVFAGGLLGEATTVRTALLVGGLGSVIAVIWALSSPVRRLTQLPTTSN
ncbi:Transmembrane secretion effector [Micromonospora echinofusca]|uniref:Transmembrane secretion effector n=1 Tax=Micromonospora echinofusca TaxID=47858 RepID=A0A1C5G793_MICEH|nr:MFS transporter [Micromonospora echinofusca]SCG15783.1 Transmembrane secretion effector [Micromonospora echinofusca]